MIELSSCKNRLTLEKKNIYFTRAICHQLSVWWRKTNPVIWLKSVKNVSRSLSSFLLPSSQLFSRAEMEMSINCQKRCCKRALIFDVSIHFAVTFLDTWFDILLASLSSLVHFMLYDIISNNEKEETKWMKTENDMQCAMRKRVKSTHTGQVIISEG